MRKVLFVIFLALLLIPLYPVYAQVPSTNSTRPTFRDLVEKSHDKAASRTAIIKDRIQDFREKVASRAANLRARLQNFKDKRKAEIAERVNNNLNKISERRTEMMSLHLDRIEQLLTKIEDRTSKVAQEGNDTSSVGDAINQAKDKINQAKTAVDEQKLKDYTLEATSEGTIRADAKVMRDKLHSDLKATHNLVVEARRAVGNVLKSLAQAISGQATKEGVENATQ